MLSALVFIKGLADAKSRLREILSPLERRELAERMLLNVVDAARRAPSVGAVVIVSPDHRMAEIKPRDVLFLRDPHSDGLNAAARFALSRLAGTATSRALLLPADLPCIKADHIERLVHAHDRRASDIIVPSADGSGTNALLLTLPPRVRLAFGPDSFHVHLANASQAGHRLDIHRCPFIGVDIDVAEDLRRAPLELVS